MSNTTENMEVEIGFTIPFTQVQNEVIDCLGFENPLDKLVYIGLLRFGYHKGFAYPSIGKLAMMNNSSKNRVRDSLDRLEKMKLIKIKKRPPEEEGKVEWSSNIYYIYDLPQNLKENTIMNDEAIRIFNKKEKDRKKEKARIRKEKEEAESKKNSGSKNEPPSSKFEPPSSKNEQPGSKFEQKEEELKKKELNNTNLITNQPIIDEIEEIGLPMKLQRTLKDMVGRLVSDEIVIKDIYYHYEARKETFTLEEYDLTLYDLLKTGRSKINSFPSLMDNWLDKARNKKNRFANNAEAGSKKSNEINSDRELTAKEMWLRDNHIDDLSIEQLKEKMVSCKEIEKNWYEEAYKNKVEDNLDLKDKSQEEVEVILDQVKNDSGIEDRELKINILEDCVESLMLKKMSDKERAAYREQKILSKRKL